MFVELQCELVHGICTLKYVNVMSLHDHTHVNVHVCSNGHGLGSNGTELLRHGLTVYWFQKKKKVWFGL